MADSGWRMVDGLTAKIELLSPAGAGALAELGNYTFPVYGLRIADSENKATQPSCGWGFG